MSEIVKAIYVNIEAEGFIYHKQIISNYDDLELFKLASEDFVRRVENILKH